MWFSGQGDDCIYRYDGNRMISFRHDSLNKNSLGLTFFEKIYADDKGMVWIGGNGLDRYDPATGIFKHYRHDEKDSGTLADNGVSAILKDHKGRLWVGTTKGLDRFDEKTEKFIHYQNDPANPKSLSNNDINFIYEDHRGVIWVGTGYRWYGLHPGEGGLNRLEPDGSFTQYLHDPKNPHSLINNKVTAIFEDSRGVFWIGTMGDGLNIMDRETGNFELFEYRPAKGDQLTGLPYEPDKINETITFIHEDETGGIWIGTRGFGINRYDRLTKKFTHYQSGNGFPDNSGWCAFTSSDGVLWVSTEENNLYRADPFLRKIDNIAIGAGRIVQGFLEDNNGD
jgi:ligand-binding sensor domain-containing protein